MSKSFIVLITFSIISPRALARPPAISGSNSAGIPFSIGIATEGPCSVQIKNDMDSVVFSHSGEWKYWGSLYIKDLRKGKYRVLVKNNKDSVVSGMTDYFTIDGNENSLDVSIVYREEHVPTKELIVTRYYGNDFNIKLNRKWNPQTQFEKDTSFLPEYEVVNTSDSMLYGIYHRFSSSVSISWVQLHYIGYLRHEKFENNSWTNISCNAPRIQLSIKPGEKGQTLKDMVLDCKKNNFQKKGRYRIRFEYGVNNTVIRMPDTNEGFTYIEPHVYQVFDEFEIK